MKIGIVEDHRLLRASYKLLLADFEYVIDADNGLEMIKQFKNLVQDNYPDLLIIDVNMPIMDGFETVSWLRTNHPNIKIIIVSNHDDEDAILRMIKLGVNSYLTKDIDPSELINVINEVNDKGNYYTSKLTEIIVKSFQNSNLSETERKIQSLTEREISILKLICDEHSGSEIAEKLGISMRTVEAHVKNMLDKLNIKTRVGLALFAQKHGLLN